MDAIDGVSNFRDLGGLPLISGGKTRDGRLLRSATLRSLSDTGVDQLRDFPVSNIIDLRTRSEDHLDPEPHVEGVNINKVPLTGGETARTVRQALAAGDEIHASDILHDMYASMIDREGDSIGQAVSVTAHALSTDDGAVLIHCTAGKDRTGLVVALILETVGVHREAIVHDYAASQAQLSGAWLNDMLAAIERVGISLGQASRQLLTLSPAEVMDDILSYIEQEHHSVREYLAEHGVQERSFNHLTETLTDVNQNA